MRLLINMLMYDETRRYDKIDTPLIDRRFVLGPA